MDKHGIRRDLCQEALLLSEQQHVEVTIRTYAARHDTREDYKFCILGALAFIAYKHPILKDVTLGGSTVGEVGEADLFDLDNGPGFIREVLTLVWDIEEVALIGTAFRGNVPCAIGTRVRFKSSTYHLFGFFSHHRREEDLTSSADRNLVKQFSTARTLRASIPDDKERYRRILQNVLAHGGLYNPRGS